MNTLKNLMTPPRLALGLGLPALILMAALMLTGQDDRGLFIPGHFAGIALLILTAAAVALFAYAAQSYGGKAKYTRMFPASVPAAAGILGAALASLWSGWSIFASGTGPLESAAAVLGLLAAAALVYLALCRHRGTSPSYLLWSVAALFLMLRLMFSYRDWSAEPELLRYCFPLLASVAVTLAFYYRTAFSVGMGSRRMYLFFSQLGAFFCLITLGAEFDLFYLGMLVWCLLDLPSLRPLKSGHPEAAPEEQP